ncbi:hypothetical protein [Wenjunlia tyrosinilytica]|jgi:hypothetical protein|uniref:hypothetical protein n=1 Tax=Wenjunlia tyrosinilytica TaxID=1544741 RepID=UPI0016670B8A|nr:hypothetical protein [Wenjunlia tyrosinilytica]
MLSREREIAAVMPWYVGILTVVETNDYSRITAQVGAVEKVSNETVEKKSV